MDGWQLLIILLITLPLRRRRARYHSPLPTPPPAASPSSSTTKTSMARRSESLRRFNYSPGEDDSRWLNSLEKEEEEKQRRRGAEHGKWRRGMRKRGRKVRTVELAQRWRKRGNDGRRRRGGLDDQSACCEVSGECSDELS